MLRSSSSGQSMQTLSIVRSAAHIRWGGGLRRFVLDPICKEAVPHDRFNRTFTTAANLVGARCCPWHASLHARRTVIDLIKQAIGNSASLTWHGGGTCIAPTMGSSALHSQAARSLQTAVA